ncbi:glycosyltransferase family 4 protein [Butyrivibrio sp. MC2013]|uniref:glycosyltransferase family 4 protein n=1 Tax=Butyrivibrio sp. MC2013 TaxID=1280686 RepID=UPI00047996AD|nr:glycosyltransferase family 4 protein [Butyrivibrio sp. MC2013]
MANILILANDSSGFYLFRKELLIELIRLGHSVRISIPDDRYAGELSDLGTDIIKTDIDRRGINPVKDIKLISSYLKLLKSLRPDLVLTYTIKPNVYGAIASSIRGIPYMSTITGLGTAFERRGIVRNVAVSLYKIACRKASCVFFQNSSNMEIFNQAGIKAPKTVLVSGSGVNTDFFSPDADYANDTDHSKLNNIADKYDSGSGHEENADSTCSATSFVYVGRLMREKGMDEFLEAAGRMKDKYGDKVSFLAVGYDDDNYAEKITSKPGLIEHLPFTKNVRAIYAAADALVQPSYHEGMSNTIMEAASMATPVLCSDIPGCRELVDDSVTGFYFKPADSASLTAAMERFMEMDADARAKMGTAARAKMLAEFDRRNVVKSYIDEIMSLL